MSKILFVYNNPLDGSYGGSQGTKKALNGFEANFEVVKYSCIKQSNKFQTLFRNICGYSGNLSPKDCKKIISLIKVENISVVYFDVSLHGRLVKKLKKLFPLLKVIVNYHNCEAQYFGDMLKAKGFLFYPIFRAAVYNEVLSKKFADFHVFITEEDRKKIGIEHNYCLIPVTLEDYYDGIEKKSNEPYILFVGAAQFANIEGAKFIIEKLSLKTNIKFLIVGKGMKKVFPGVYHNVEVFDYVPNLGDIYKGAIGFISPLFSGSGAKVKIAEALMFGKYIIGTSLSFLGYEMKGGSYNICETSKDFIAAIENLDINKNYYAENRTLFLDKYDALNNRLYYSEIIKQLNMEDKDYE